MSPELPPPPPPPPSFNPGPGVPTGEPKTSAAALWSLILGVLSLFCCCVTGLPGLILGIVGLVNIGKSQGRLKGKGLAIAGIILSCLFPVAESAVFSVMQQSADPKIKKFFESFGEVFKTGQEMSNGTMQATALATALQSYADGHNGELPPDLNTLVTENLIESTQLDAPSGVADPTFWTLTEAGRKVSELSPEAVVLKGGPLTIMTQEFYIVVRANWKVEPIESARLK